MTHEEIRELGGYSCWPSYPLLLHASADDVVWIWPEMIGFTGASVSVLVVKSGIMPTPCDLGCILEIELGRC